MLEEEEYIQRLRVTMQYKIFHFNFHHGFNGWSESLGGSLLELNVYEVFDAYSKKFSPVGLLLNAFIACVDIRNFEHQ